MRFLYVSRQFNRSGFYILEELLNNGLIPVGVLLPSLNDVPELNDVNQRSLYIKRYEEHCNHNNIPFLRFTESIKILAEKNKIPVYIEETIKSKFFFNLLSSLSLDLIVLGGGWPELLPPEVIALPNIGCINTHPSLLPEFRGTDVHRWQIYYGVKESGTTIHYIDNTFDTGPILGQEGVVIDDSDTPQKLFDKTAKAAGRLIVSIIEDHKENYPSKLNGVIQSGRKNANKYYSKWNWEDAEFMKILWHSDKENIYRKILASTQEDYLYNGPFSYYKGKKWIFRKAERVRNRISNFEAGTIIDINEAGLIIATKDENEQLLVHQLQEGSIKGYPEEPNIGTILTGLQIKKSGIFLLKEKFGEDNE